MSRRRARSAPATHTTVTNYMPVSATVPWSYLASLLSVVGAGLLVVVANVAVSPAICSGSGGDAADCRFGWGLWFGLIGFVVSLVPIARAVHLSWGFVLAVVGLGLIVLSLDAVEQPWWWALALLVPAVAALVSADWQRGRGFCVAQYVVIAAIGVAAVVATVLWFLGS